MMNEQVECEMRIASHEVRVARINVKSWARLTLLRHTNGSSIRMFTLSLRQLMHGLGSIAARKRSIELTGSAQSQALSPSTGDER